MTSNRAASVSLALALAFSTTAFAAPAAQKGESTFRSIGAAFRSGMQSYKERRAAAGPGLLTRTALRTGAAIETGTSRMIDGTRNGAVALGDGIKSTGTGIKRGIRNSLVGRMTIGLLDGVRATGRVIARPFKRMAMAVKREKATIQNQRVAKLANDPSLGLTDIATMEQSGKISRKTAQGVYDMRTAKAPGSRAAEVNRQTYDRLLNDPNVGLRELEQMKDHGLISGRLKNKIVDARLATPVSRDSVVGE